MVAYCKFPMLLTTLAYTGNIIIMAVELRDGQREKGGLKRQGRYQGLCIAVKKKGGLTIKKDLFCFMVLDSSVLGGSALGTWVRHGYGRDLAEGLLHGRQEAGRGDARVTLAFSFPHFYVWVALLMEWC